MLRLRINKSSMRHPPCSPINLRIKALDKRHQVRRLPIPVVPLDICIRLNGVRLALTVRVDQLSGHKVTIRDRVRISHSQRVLQDWFDRTPDVNDLVPAFQELGCVVGEVVGDSVLGCFVGLVDVHALHGAADLRADRAVWWCAADGVVEDEDSRGASAIRVLLEILRRSVLWWEYVRVFQQLLCLWVVFPLDLLVI
jgi:hypothetical protein